ncbi:MAG: DUF4256 family protein, partial [Verrucomicrobiaceae bacterium]
MTCPSRWNTAPARTGWWRIETRGIPADFPKQMSAKSKKKLTAGERKEILAALETRFGENGKRHEGIRWRDVLAKLEKADAKLWSLQK